VLVAGEKRLWPQLRVTYADRFQSIQPYYSVLLTMYLANCADGSRIMTDVFDQQLQGAWTKAIRRMARVWLDAIGTPLVACRPRWPAIVIVPTLS